MSVAPSFKDYKRLSEPFEEGGKWYIMVEHPRTKNSRKVRWYGEEKKISADWTKNKNAKGEIHWPGLKHARGFDNGPILCIRGVKTDEELWWCRLSCARFAVDVGWHIVSTDIAPPNPPPNLKFLLLSWDEFKDEDDFHKKPVAELNAIIRQKERNKEFIPYPS